MDVQPADRIVEENIFDSEAGFYSALNGIYAELSKGDLYGSALGSEYIEILAQQYNIRPANVSYTEVAGYRYTNEYPKQRFENIWNAAYKAILNCNIVLANSEKYSSSLTSKSKGVIVGETLGIRAFLHFDMLRLFGPIYKDSPQDKSIPYMDKSSVSSFPLLPASEAIQRILQDLDQAEKLLQEADPIISEGPRNTTIANEENTYLFRTLKFNYYAVLALKARVYLYAGDKENALKYSKLVIDAPNRASYFPFIQHSEILGNAANPDCVFSTEILFGLFNSNRNQIFQNNFNPEASRPENLLIPRPGIVAAMFQGEESDYRYFPIWKNSNLETNAMFTTKYKVGNVPTAFRNNIQGLIRLSELYLIAAECEPNAEQAFVYLNTLRNNRGLTDVSDNLSSRLLSEYRKEFFGEGQLFYYYKRNKVSPIRSGISNNNMGMTAARYVPLLPDSELKYRD